MLEEDDGAAPLPAAAKAAAKPAISPWGGSEKSKKRWLKGTPFLYWDSWVLA